MADPPSYPDSNGDTSVGSDHGLPPSTPRWVKVFGIIVLVLVLMVVIMMFTGIGGPHGPGRHIPSGDVVETPSGGPDGHTPPIEHGVQQP